MFEVIVGAGVAALVGRGIYHRFLSRKAKIRRALSRSKRRPIKDIVTGPARVTGHARTDGKLLVAPVTRRPCLAYELRVERKIRGIWTHVLTLRQVRSFLVVDETGAMEVHPRGHCRLALVEDGRDGSGWIGPDDTETFSNLIKLLQAENIALEERFLGSTFAALRYREGVVEQDEIVSVCGQVVAEVRADGERGAPRAAPEVLLLLGTSEGPLLISDEPGVTRSQPNART